MAWVKSRTDGNSGADMKLLAACKVVGQHEAVQGRDADVVRGREACADAAWLDASAHLLRADEVVPLEPMDLELLVSCVISSLTVWDDGVCHHLHWN